MHFPCNQRYGQVHTRYYAHFLHFDITVHLLASSGPCVRIAPPVHVYMHKITNRSLTHRKHPQDAQERGPACTRWMS
jgi:hypothetical protein